MKYFAFCDPSGGSSDSMTLGIARTSLLGKKAVLVGCWEKRAPFNPDAVTEEFAEILKSYRLTTVCGDKYAAQWVIERFRAHGITYIPSTKTKSDIYLEFLALVNSGRVKIPSDRRLAAQLVRLERRASRSGGKDVVDHPLATHDDAANCVAGCLCLAAAEPFKRKFHMPVVLTVRCGTAFAPLPLAPPDTPFVDPQAGQNLNDPFLELPHDDWHKL